MKILECVCFFPNKNIGMDLLDVKETKK